MPSCIKLLSRITAEDAEICNKRVQNLHLLYIFCSTEDNVFRLSIVFLFLQGQADFFIYRCGLSSFLVSVNFCCLNYSFDLILQASGVTVNDEVIKVFNDMKVRKSSTPEEIKKRKKAVLFCLSDDKKQIIVEESKQILVGDIGDTVEDPYTAFVKLLPLNDCRYALYDATYETKESKKEDLVFIFWCVKAKLAVKIECSGVNAGWLNNCFVVVFFFPLKGS